MRVDCLVDKYLFLVNIKTLLSGKLIQAKGMINLLLKFSLLMHFNYICVSFLLSCQRWSTKHCLSLHSQTKLLQHISAAKSNEI